MIVKAGNDYLEITDSIQVEKKVKLFEDVSSTQGDFSYSFVIPKTSNNQRIIEIYSTNDLTKKWVRKLNADLLNDQGMILHSGYIRIENRNDREYSASFFSGNSNWIEELNFNLIELSWERYDVPAIATSFTRDYGVVFPLIDNGLLATRKTPYFSRDDFQGFIYVKDIINNVLSLNGMKLNGDLLNIPEYNQLITTSGGSKFLDEVIREQEAYVANSSNQSIPGGTVYTTIDFPVITDPYYPGSDGNWVTFRYFWSEDTKEFDIEVRILLDNGSSGYGFRILKNGFSAGDAIYSTVGSPNTKKLTFNFDESDLGFDQPAAGDFYLFQIAFLTGRDVLAGSTVKVSPRKLLRTLVQDTIPDMTAKDLLSNVFRMFNIIVSYNHLNKTITANKFDEVLNTDPIDLSEHISIDEDNFEEIVSDYAKNNQLIWQDQSSDYVDEYNSSNQYPYASGILSIDNDFLEELGDFLEMDFTAPWQQNYNFIGIELPYTGYVTESVRETRSISGVSDDGSGNAEFNYSGSNLTGYYIVRISESTVADYNGDYYADLSSGVFNSYYPYIGNATAQMEVLSVEASNSNPVFLLNHPSQSVPEVMDVDSIGVILVTPLTTVAIANFLETENFHGSLHFDDLKRRFFTGTEKLLNTGVKSYASGNLPEKIYNELDFLNTVRINESVFYVNLISGYQGSKYNVSLELIKK